MRSHATGSHLTTALLLLVGIVLGLVVSTLSESSSSGTASLFFLTHVTTRLSFLNFDWLAEDLEGLCETSIDGGFTVEGNESETSRSASVFVHHEGGIDDSTELHEVFLEVLFSSFLRDTADEDLAGLLLLVSGNGTFRIDLKIGG